MDFKTCCTCKQIKPVNQFSKNKASKDGLKEYCKSCASIASKKYRQSHLEEVRARNRSWYETTKANSEIRTQEALILNSKTCTVCGESKPLSEFYRRGNGGFYGRCKLCERKAQKEFRDKNAEHIREQKKRYNFIRKSKIDSYNHVYYKNHPEKVRARVVAWINKNPEKYKEQSVRGTQRRIAKAKALPSDFSSSDWAKCKMFFSDESGTVHCAYCNKPLQRATQDHVIPVDKGGGYTRDNIVPACGKCNSSKGSRSLSDWFSSQEFYSKEQENKIIEYLNSVK